MLFNTAQFAFFFFGVLFLYRVLPRRGRNSLLLAASAVFYTLWHPVYLLLLAAEIVVNFALLQVIARRRAPRVALVGSIVFTLGLLAFFKYAALAVESVLPVLRLAGMNPPIPNILLPLGISFYSFQIVSLAIDTYRGEIEAPRRLSRYALFISFFPQLIAGPILRGAEFLPQLERGGEMNADRTRRGIWLIASGIAKKVILADFLLAPFVDEVFLAPGVGGAPFHLLAMYSFAFQIYFDFSGYTDIARGLACMLGFELPFNFMEPYLSRNPSEFWHRWHITLSTWLRDYLYIPLGGNRVGNVRTYVNLLLTMLLGGLWHGAAWNFVVWGGLHGALLMLHRRFRRSRFPDRPLALRDAPKVLLLFHVVCLIWIFFRVPTFSAALDFLQALIEGDYLSGWPAVPVLIVLLCAGLQVLERLVRLHIVVIRQWLSAPWGTAIEATALGALVGLAIAVSGAGGEFIYFQF